MVGNTLHELFRSLKAKHIGTHTHTHLHMDTHHTNIALKCLHQKAGWVATIFVHTHYTPNIASKPTGTSNKQRKKAFLFDLSLFLS